MNEEAKDNRTRDSFLSGKVVVLPAPGNGWNVFSLEDSRECVFRALVQEKEDLSQSNVRVVGLPISSVLNFPLILNTVDRGVISELVKSQCERNGLLAGIPGETIFDYEIISQEESVTRVVVFVLAAYGLKGLDQISAKHFDISSNLYDLPENAFCFWREGGQLTVTVRRNGKVVYAQALSDSSITREVITELRCMQLQLSETFESEAVPDIYTYGSFEAQEIKELHDVFNLDVFQKEQLTATLPDRYLNLVPYKIRQKRKEEQNKERIKKGIALAVLAYVGFVVGWGLFVAKTSYDVWSLRTSLEENAGTVSEIEKTYKLWNSLEPVIDSDYFPLELLSRCVHGMDSANMAFIQFKIDRGQIVIRGEAKNLSTVFDYKNLLDENDALGVFSWDLREPQIRPDGKTLFTIQGVARDAN